MTVYAPTNPESYAGAMMAKGVSGEAYFRGWLDSTGLFGPTNDLRHDKAAQSADIDFEAVHRPSGRTYTFEVKHDQMAETGNMAFEIQRLYHTPHPHPRIGWGWGSKADFLAAVSPKVGQIWLVRFDELRAAVNIWVKRERKKARVCPVASDQRKTTYIHPVPRAVLDPIPSFTVI